MTPMELRRWPRKNDAASIRARQEAVRGLTDDGELIAELHRELHEEMNRGTRDFLLRYSGADLQVLVRVLGDLAGADKVGVRLVPPTETP